jgi:hypothetical protein
MWPSPSVGFDHTRAGGCLKALADGGDTTLLHQHVGGGERRGGRGRHGVHGCVAHQQRAARTRTRCIVCEGRGGADAGREQAGGEQAGGDRDRGPGGVAARAAERIRDHRITPEMAGWPSRKSDSG